MLMIMVTIVKTEATGFENPSEYFNPIAQATSKSPAMKSTIQFIKLGIRNYELGNNFG